MYPHTNHIPQPPHSAGLNYQGGCQYIYLWCYLHEFLGLRPRTFVLHVFTFLFTYLHIFVVILYLQRRPFLFQVLCFFHPSFQPLAYWKGPNDVVWSPGKFHYSLFISN